MTTDSTTHASRTLPDVSNQSNSESESELARSQSVEVEPSKFNIVASGSFVRLPQWKDHRGRRKKGEAINFHKYESFSHPTDSATQAEAQSKQIENRAGFGFRQT